MSNVAVVVLCFVAGFAARRVAAIPPDAPRALHAFALRVALPALVLLEVSPVVSRAAPGGRVMALIAMPWLHFGLAFVVVRAVGAARGWSRRTTGAAILAAGLGNTSFVGYPLIEGLLGRAVLPFAVIVDQPGSFLAMSTVGVITAAAFGAGEVDGRSLARRVVTFPPFVALLLAVLWGLAAGAGRHFVEPVLAPLARTLAPVAVFAVGASLEVDRATLRRRFGAVSLLLALKLLVMPVVFFALYGALFPRTDLAFRVIVLEAAMPPMVTAAVLVAQFELDEELAALMIGLGVPLALVTVPLFHHFLAR